MVKTVVLTGKVKFYYEAKGYGFIKEDNSENEYFFHCSKTPEKNLQKEEKVSFDLEEGKKGLNAINVKRLV
jgi:CspA family cold shock protein